MYHIVNAQNEDIEFCGHGFQWPSDETKSNDNFVTKTTHGIHNSTVPALTLKLRYQQMLKQVLDATQQSSFKTSLQGQNYAD